MLRKHQTELSNIIDGIIAGDQTRTIIAHVVPGGGKSALPIIAGRLITAGLADALCWICPRTALQNQGEKNFIDPFFRRMLNHRLTVRASTNEVDPCRGHAGLITTYQAVGVDQGKTLLPDFNRKRYILILDEFHHCEAEGMWTQAIQPLMDRAAFRIMFTGTLARGDEKPIAFIPYSDSGRPVLDDSPDTRVIRYTRTDALTERAIIPLQFHLHDGHAKWQTETGNEVSARLAKVIRKDAGAAVYTALSTEYANELLELSFDHWQEHRRRVPGARFLIVTPGIKQAKNAVKLLKSRWEHTEIATSHENKACIKAIKNFKAGKINCLVSIAVPYEGLDVPEISHIACLTHIRSTQWLEQCISRAVRIDPAAGPYETQTGYIFAPDDPLFRDIVDQIQAEQIACARIPGAPKEKNGKQLSLFDDQKKEGESNPYRIKPLSSELTGRRELALGGNGNGVLHPVQMPFPKTPSEIEAELREDIEKHVRAYEFNNRYMPGKLNREIKRHFGKGRDLMTGNELQAVLRHVQATYPLSRIRGTGRRRVPTRAQEWRQEA